MLFLGACFVVPLAQLFALSFSAKAGPLSAYAELLQSEVFRDVFIGTVKLAVTVTCICVLLAYPAAYLLTRIQGTALAIALYCVLVPFWVSGVVRTLAWVILLQDSGVINRGLLAVGLDKVKLILQSMLGVAGACAAHEHAAPGHEHVADKPHDHPHHDGSHQHHGGVRQ